jgi:hypothetical protein
MEELRRSQNLAFRAISLFERFSSDLSFRAISRQWNNNNNKATMQHSKQQQQQQQLKLKESLAVAPCPPLLRGWTEYFRLD